jgi:excisionase family DNA binding protein
MTGTSESNGRLRWPKELSVYLGVPVATLDAWRYKGVGPRFMKVGRHVRYRAEDVEAWLSEQAKTPTC